MTPPSRLGGAWRTVLVVLASLLAIITAACGDGNNGFPKQAGQYTIQPGSLSYDGKSYTLLWSDAIGQFQKAEGRNVRMERDERTFLEVGNSSPVIHLKEDEAVTVRGRDRDGAFESPWFPFFLGYAVGGGLSGPTINQRYPGDSYRGGPTYQYPPTDSFGRGDSLHGSIERSKAEAPDYSKVQPAPYAVSGQSGGTGGGNAATNKATGANSGQSGGTGSGSAASNKGTFSANGGGTGVNGGAGFGGSKPDTGTGSSGTSAGSGGAATNKSTSPPPSAPRSAPSAPSRRR
jgi:hypothetical protein